ncbi:MAG TPA: peptide ABC transporter substrate-binding protein [Candidatus Limnocylindria bacterium]|nr:peptide ABC transporter substrate-binding protein [Candidatus Limnocylindria bacterium]
MTLDGPSLPAGLVRRLAALLAILLLAAGVVPRPIGTVSAAGAPLRYLGGEIGALDPAFIADAGDVQLQLQLYAGLTRLDEQGEPYPSLARSWDVSSDGLTYTFHLRDGLRFSDGSPLDASDVRRSWLRLLDPAVHATAPDVLNLIAGAGERLAGGPEDAVGVRAQDATTLIVTLRHPAGYFTAITATPSTFVVPRSATGAPDWQDVDSFVGSGPYVIDGRDGTDLLLRANEDYVAGAPPIAEVRWVTDLDGDPVTAFSNGTLDLTGVSSADAGWIAYDRELGRHLHKAAALDVQYFGFNTRTAPFDDPAVRRAFALALDRPKLVELAAGTASLPATSIVPPALQLDGQPPDPASNVDEARRLLDDAGYRDRSKLGTITVNATGLDASSAVAAWKEALAVDVSVETMDFDDYLTSVATDPPQIFTINWIADYPSPYALYSLLLLPGAASNYGRWDDPQFVELLEAAAAGDDPHAQAQAYAAVEERVDDQAPVIPWSYDESWWLTSSNLRGLGNLTIGLLDFGRLSWDA